ncbi:MAG: 1,4-alpha-glucan branching protein GlgB [Verrucomicrobiota bacterium]|nr:1,4-alpha-glucan branching protein GlgB [Verrucomicrobiota bacterium]
MYTQNVTQFSHHDPHHRLGLHGREIFLWRPGAETLYLEVFGKIVAAERLTNEGLFRYLSNQEIGPLDYRVYHQSGLLTHDPYAFSPTIGPVDLYLFNKGCHYLLYQVLGAHLCTHCGVRGVRFALWAPNATAVSLIADFNFFDGRVNPMRSMGSSGIWEIFIPGIMEGEKYKFEIRTKEGYLRVKSDPFAFYSEIRPRTASVIANVDNYRWSDAKWMEERPHSSLTRPILIYEVHLGSWREYDSPFPNYRKLAVDLAQYCQQMHFTHVELLPVMEHPLDESWGYQVTGFFSVTSRYGTVEDFQFFVDHMHNSGIGVILDWVPAHFPTDDFSLNRFDGTALYEHDDPRQGIHPHWHTAIFNYGRHEVTNFLLASALFWLDKMHVDGIRVDAVASMLYLDYGRKAGEWIPTPDGSNYNVAAISFLQHLNSTVHERFPGVLMVAEESSSYHGVTHPVSQGGLGFDCKWNMGWMNDTLRYFSKDPIYRKYHQNELTFSLLYAFSEQFACVLSHDEVVHGKRSLLSKMPGDDWQKFANLRLLYSYQMCHPGKKLLFMGGELGQWDEWNSAGQIHWHLLAYPLHEGMHRMVRELNQFVKEERALWEEDFSWKGYEWVDFSDADHSVISYMRHGTESHLLCIHHFTPEVEHNYWIGLPLKQIVERFNSDAVEYGGSGVLNREIAIEKEGFRLTLPPLATCIFEVHF